MSSGGGGGVSSVRGGMAEGDIRVIDCDVCEEVVFWGLGRLYFANSVERSGISLGEHCFRTNCNSAEISETKNK